MALNQTGTITLSIIAKDLASGQLGKVVSGLDKMAKQSGIAGWAVKGAALQMGQMLNPAMLVAKGLGMVTDLMGDSVKAASDMAETQSKLDVVFGRNASAMRA